MIISERTSCTCMSLYVEYVVFLIFINDEQVDIVLLPTALLFSSKPDAKE